MSYQDDRDFADRLNTKIMQIVGPYLLMPTPNEIDCKQAADLMVLAARDMRIAARVRKPGFLDQFRYQFTIRAVRESGAETELAKIVNGWGDLLFYAHLDEAQQNFELWWLVDLHAFRAALIRDESNRKKGKGLVQGKSYNSDGQTGFVWFDLRSFPPTPPILIASSEPLPPPDKLAVLRPEATPRQPVEKHPLPDQAILDALRWQGSRETIIGFAPMVPTVPPHEDWDDIDVKIPACDGGV